MASKTAKKKVKSSKPAAKATPREPKTARVRAVPVGYHSVTPYLSVKDAAAAIAFYQRAFGAVEKTRYTDGARIGHAELRIGDSIVMLADEYPEMGFNAPPAGSLSSVSMMLYVTDVDAVVARAVAAGARLERPVADQFYGDRLGTVIDPFGQRWYLATHVEDVSEEELQRRMQAMQHQG
jgi:PhnB protein